MIEIRTLHVRSGALRDGPEIGSERFRVALLDAFIALPQGFLDDAGHRRAGGLGDGLGKPVGFGVFDVQSHVSFLLYSSSIFLYPSSFQESLQGGLAGEWTGV